MSRSAALTLNFDGRTLKLALGVNQLDALRDATGQGPEMVYRMLRDGSWLGAEFITEPLRLALIGGGMDEPRARALVARMAGPGKLLAMRNVAMAVLVAVLVGIEDDPDAPAEPAPEAASA